MKINMINTLSLYLKKYFVPFVFTAVGLTILILGFANNQSGIFKFSAVLMLGAGAISILYSAGNLKPLYVYLIGGIMWIVALISIYMSYDSVATSQQFTKDKSFCMELSKQNLSDISFIQKAYKEQNGVYAGTWKELVDYTNTGTSPQVISEGVVPNERITVEERDYLYGDDRPIDNNMTETEAYRLSKWTEGPRYAMFAGFKRDTVQVSIMQSKFLTRSYAENRIKLGFPVFNAEDLPYIPSTKKKQKWNLEVKDSINVNGIAGPSIYISGKIPFPEIEGGNKMIEMSLGNIKTFEHTGSWEDE